MALPGPKTVTTPAYSPRAAGPAQIRGMAACAKKVRQRSEVVGLQVHVDNSASRKSRSWRSCVRRRREWCVAAELGEDP
jgi:hypothetical protein